MKGFYLTKEQLADLRIAHRCERNKHAAYKINAVILLGDGWKLKQVREALLLDDETLRKYVAMYPDGGIEELVKTYYKGKEPYLTEAQCELLMNELDGAIHLSSKSVINYVERNFKIVFSVTGMRDFLHRLGYEYKNPKLVPGNPDEEAQEIFAQQYEEFMLKKPGDVEVLFADAVHPEHNGMAAYGWIKRGEKRQLKTNSGRQRLNLHGAINAETLQVTLIESDTVNAESTINLLATIERIYPLHFKVRTRVNAKFESYR